MRDLQHAGMWKKDVSCKTLKSYYSKERMRKDKTRN